MSKMTVKTGDTVIVISGEGRKQKDKPAQKGKVQKVFPENGRIIVAVSYTHLDVYKRQP